LSCPPEKLIEVSVVRVSGNQVRLGTDAPKHLPVVREELLEREEIPAKGQNTKFSAFYRACLDT